jgi:hypothetical protein
MKNRIYILFAVLLVVFSVQLHAQIGVVLDVNTHESIFGANVLVVGTTLGTSANEDGVFSLQGFPKPPFQIRVSAVGYETGIFEVSEISKNDTITILLKPDMQELAGTIIRARRIRTSGCNSGTPGWGEGWNWSLGTIDRGDERTVSRGNLTQTWSYPVEASKCQKSTFEGASSAISYNADCRSNPEGYRGSFFSWCAVSRFKDSLCPYPWRVPTRDDFRNLFTILCDDIPRGDGWFFARYCHYEYLTTWGGIHHGLIDSSGRFGWNRTMLLVENFPLDEIDNPTKTKYYYLGWCNLAQDIAWIVFDRMQQQTKSVSYWSQQPTSDWDATAMTLSAYVDRDTRRGRTRNDSKFSHYMFSPSSFDKSFGLTLRCVKD